LSTTHSWKCGPFTHKTVKAAHAQSIGNAKAAKAVSASSAAHVIAGFRYQLLQSVSALIALRDNEELLLEVSEDFTIVAQDGATDVQVKNSQAAKGPRPFSLQSPEVASVLQRYWEASNGGVLKRRLIFLARGGAAVERDYSFPGELPGLAYWRAAALGAHFARHLSAHCRRCLWDVGWRLILMMLNCAPVFSTVFSGNSSRSQRNSW
jgi:hypothetical protein